MKAAQLAQDLENRLRRCGVVVHLAAALSDRQVVIFLEEALGQHEQARAELREVATVTEVRFSDLTSAVMYVSVSRAWPVHGSTATTSCADARLVASSGTPLAHRRTTRPISGTRALPVNVT